MNQEQLSYEILDFAASLFAGEHTGFSHHDMTNFFCHELSRHPNEIEIPNINRKDKFKWWLGQFSVPDQRRVLEDLCRREFGTSLNYRWPSDKDRQQLLRNLGSSQVAMPPCTRIDTTTIQDAWRKAQERVLNDPEGAITAARTLLESVCKHVLDELSVQYGDNADLPKLYSLTSKELNLAPSQQTEDSFKKILGGAHSVVDGLANLRNRIGDAHGQGKRPVKPLPRHAELAVNMAGSMASFLLATFEAKK